jgi:alpha-methylacyl-CoA racemase
MMGSQFRSADPRGRRKTMGPLAGIRLIELGGIGPGPMAAMMLGDMGADIIRVERIQTARASYAADPKFAVNSRSRRSIAVDLRKPAGVEVILRLVERADGLMEPFRPGVADRLGVGPTVCLARNPALVYGRMTGWGQTGPLADAAGHDLNYIALTGALHAIGRKGQKPAIPLNLIGDYGGGGMLLAFGMVCGLLETMKSGKGQVVDAAMIDGAAILFSAIYGMHASGSWRDERASNVLDGAAHFYDVYETSDEKYVSVGSIEPQFYTLLLDKLGLAGENLPDQMDRSNWATLSEQFAAIFKTKTRDQWCAIMEGTDICFAPVLSIAEAPEHQHAKARDAYVDVGGVRQPAPAPRFSRTPGYARPAPSAPGVDSDDVLEHFGFMADERAELRAAGVIG